MDKNRLNIIYYHVDVFHYGKKRRYNFNDCFKRAILPKLMHISSPDRGDDHHIRGYVHDLEGDLIG